MVTLSMAASCRYPVLCRRRTSSVPRHRQGARRRVRIGGVPSTRRVQPLKRLFPSSVKRATKRGHRLRDGLHCRGGAGVSSLSERSPCIQVILRRVGMEWYRQRCGWLGLDGRGQIALLYGLDPRLPLPAPRGLRCAVTNNTRSAARATGTRRPWTANRLWNAEEVATAPGDCSASSAPWYMPGIQKAVRSPVFCRRESAPRTRFPRPFGCAGSGSGPWGAPVGRLW